MSKWLRLLGLVTLAVIDEVSVLKMMGSKNACTLDFAGILGRRINSQLLLLLL